MNIGILGTGFGRYHAELYKKVDSDYNITIFGRNKEKLQEIEKSLAIKTTTNINDIILNNDIDLVDICLPNHLHAEYIIKAFQNGKNVFCETPLCTSIDETNRILQAQSKHGKKVFVNQFIKHEYPYRYLYDTVKDGSLGNLRSLSIQRKTPALWGDLSLDNIVTNLMIHEFDLITWMLGMPKKISSYGKNGESGKSNVTCILDYYDTIVTIESSSMLPTQSPFTVGYEAIFDNGVINYFEHGFHDRCESSLVLTTDKERKIIEVQSAKHCYKSIEHVLGCVQNDTEAIQSLDDAIMAMELALSIKGNMVECG